MLYNIPRNRRIPDNVLSENIIPGNIMPENVILPFFKAIAIAMNSEMEIARNYGLPFLFSC